MLWFKFLLTCPTPWEFTLHIKINVDFHLEINFKDVNFLETFQASPELHADAVGWLWP